MTTTPVKRVTGCLLAALAVMLSLIACEKADEPGSNNGSAAHPYVVHHDRHINTENVKRGSDVYQQHCAECHGKKAEGHPRWQWLGEDGKFPPPPLDGSGHTWHHTMILLHDIIKNGSPGGQGNMPAWKNKLSDEQIDDVIAWFQSLWPNDIYKAWYEMNESASKGKQW